MRARHISESDAPVAPALFSTDLEQVLLLKVLWSLFGMLAVMAPVFGF